MSKYNRGATSQDCLVKVQWRLAAIADVMVSCIAHRCGRPVNRVAASRLGCTPRTVGEYSPCLLSDGSKIKTV